MIINDASELPKIAEPHFFYLDAEIDWYPVMLPEDLAKASIHIAEAARKWG